jgi:putative peptide zinc metalloprotease protein
MLSPLRQELQLHPGPAGSAGAPSWTLHDPASNRFFRISWPIFEMIARWHLGDARRIAETVAAETTLHPSEEDVMRVAGFLASNELLRPLGPRDTARMAGQAAARRQSWWQWLLHHYLFIRIPLVRPDRFLASTLSYVEWVCSPWFLALTGMALILGTLLIGRQWDIFRATLVDTFSLSGLLAYGLALGGVKAMHELGHAYTARRFGCRVPSMGVALMVLWPVLYTDVNETWKLPRRHDRLAVGAAGVAVELAVAAWASLAWGILPDGPVRSAAFILATSTWISSLFLNLSPFMRFDGYFLLMDALDIPNLHQRSFALARWWLREALFGLGEPAPERFSPGRRRLLIAFSFAVWIYRLLLFLGIAAMVYHFFIKVVGILLFAVEMGWFVLRPIWGEAADWWRRRHRIAASRRSLLPVGGLILVLLTLALPWRDSIQAPAMLKAGTHVGLFLPATGRIEGMELTPGRRVEAGEVLARLSSPDVEHRIAQLGRRIRILEFELASYSFESSFRERSKTLREELETTLSERLSLRRELVRMEVAAPIGGWITDPIPDLNPGQWIGPRERLAAIRGEDGGTVDAYVPETLVGRVSVGGRGRFLPENSGMGEASPCHIVSVERVALRTLADPALASTGGGPVPVRLKDGRSIPETALYRVQCRTEGSPPSRQLRGTAILEAEAESLTGGILHYAVATLLRETGM